MHLYIAFTSLLILVSVRIVGVSFSEKRLPQIIGAGENAACA